MKKINDKKVTFKIRAPLTRMKLFVFRIFNIKNMQSSGFWEQHLQDTCILVVHTKDFGRNVLVW